MAKRASGNTTSPGRGLDASRDAVILDAALQLVSELGYDRVTMDAIAGRAHSSKATMYRRWDSKASLVVDALKARHQHTPVLPDTGDIRGDLLAGVATMCHSLTSEDLALLTGLITASRSDPELARLLREQMVDSKLAASRRWTQRAIERGLLPPNADLELFHDVAPAMVFMRTLVTGEPLDDAFVTRIVDTVLLPIFQGSATPPVER